MYSNKINLFILGMCKKKLVSGNDYNIPDGHLAASSEWTDKSGPDRARLNTQASKKL